MKFHILNKRILSDKVNKAKTMESYPSGLRERSAKPSFSGSNPLDSYRASKGLGAFFYSILISSMSSNEM